MTNTITPRYLATYRQRELTRICNAAKEGQSLCFVGVAGVGKSNITNFLHSDPYGYKPNYLGKEAGSIHFPVIDGNTWDGTPEGLWKQMRTALAESTQHLDKPAPDPKLIQISEDQRAFSELNQRVKWLCQEQEQRVVFILDDFDGVIRMGPLSMLEQFNALRSDGNRGQLSYLIFTKRLPRVLERVHGAERTSKFYDLFSQHIYALGMYTPDDEHQMLAYLNEGAGRPLRSQELVAIKTLAGGHARLLKLLFDLWRTYPPQDEKHVAHFLRQNDVRGECQRILQGLHEQEQEVAKRIAKKETTVADQPLIDHLAQRGMIIDTGEWTWFSRLFEQFLRQ